MKPSILTALLLFVTVYLHADNIKTTDGKEYKNVTVSRVEPDGIVLVTDSGIEKIPFTSLPRETQLKYGYDAQKAAAYAARVAAAQHELFTKNQQELQKAHAQEIAIAEAPEKEKAAAQAKADAEKKAKEAKEQAANDAANAEYNRTHATVTVYGQSGDNASLHENGGGQ